jgi:hypothetical protein
MTAHSETSSRRLRRSDLALLVFLLVVAAAGYLLAQRQQAQAPVTLPPSTCDINFGPCRVDLPGGGSLQLAIDPHPAPTLRPFRVDLRLDGITAERVWLEVNGASMDMGQQQIVLAPLADQPGRYQGTLTLPVCTTGPMIWRATVRSEAGAGGRALAVPFDFAAGGH